MLFSSGEINTKRVLHTLSLGPTVYCDIRARDWPERKRLVWIIQFKSAAWQKRISAPTTHSHLNNADIFWYFLKNCRLKLLKDIKSMFICSDFSFTVLFIKMKLMFSIYKIPVGFLKNINIIQWPFFLY